MSDSYVNQLQTLDAHTLNQKLNEQTITLIDVREGVEFAGEHIPGAILVPLSHFDFAKLPQAKDRPLVVYCRSGHRSAIAAQKLFQAGFESVSHLSHGIADWKNAGYTTTTNQTAPISIMRQVQITAGSFVLIGTVLGVLVSPWFLLLSGLVGTGLIFSGVTDTCLMGTVLAKLPYNQRSQG